jgi:isocitrate lyase
MERQHILLEHWILFMVHMILNEYVLIIVAQMAKYLETVYVSGWQCSSTASTSNEPGPDLADYPMDTVPNKVCSHLKGMKTKNA